jgi:hypothetical protein
MFSVLKKLAIATTVAAAILSLSSLATSQIFYTGDDTGVVIVAVNESQDASLILDAARLFDARDLIRLEYGTTSLDTLLRVKQVIAPEGIAVKLDDSSISSQDNSSALNVVLEVSADHAETGTFPVVVVLENTETGATTTIALTVQVQ